MRLGISTCSRLYGFFPSLRKVHCVCTYWNSLNFSGSEPQSSVAVVVYKQAKAVGLQTRTGFSIQQVLFRK